MNVPTAGAVLAGFAAVVLIAATPDPATALQRSDPPPEPTVSPLAREPGSPSPVVHDVVVRRNVGIPMRDGLELMADIYFPAEGDRILDGEFGALLQRTPYDKAGDRYDRLGRRYAAMGYVTVVQDERGRFESPGREFKYGEQAEDGHDTVEWIAAQNWSNGRVGTFGASTPGQNQNSLATLDPDGLAAMVVAVAGGDYGDLALRHQGTYQLRFFAHQFTSQIRRNRRGEENPVYRQAVEQELPYFEEWLWRLPFPPELSPFKYFPENAEWFYKTYTYSDFPGPEDWWLKRGFNIPAYYDEHADVATIYIGSWFDTYSRAQSDHFAEISERKPNTPKRLFFHPLGHTERLTRTWAGDLDFGTDVLWDFETFRIKWYDRFVKGIENEIVEETSPVTIFVMGGGEGTKDAAGRMSHGGRWRYGDAWPLPGTRFTPFYLHRDGTLTEDRPTAPDASTTYQYDPEDPVPSVGSHQSGFNPYLPAGPYDQRCDPERFIGCDDHLPLETRPDVLVFKSAPLEEDVEVIGPVDVKVYVSSDAPDTDFSAKLIDEYPPNADYPYGFQMYLAKGIARARYRDGREEARFMEPGEVYEMTIRLHATANRFARGHRIVVHVSSSDFPEFDRNPNTGEPLGRSRMKRVAVNTVHQSAEHPSHILLPIAPAEE